ncbi:MULTISPECIES: DedA family protein [unclassified Azospirillum]|uniref:DedA family protein n=1 Tax=unclassified Azospirillum TaxID=2630922 RepID=UPI001FFF858C|nr:MULTISPECIES: DedA family protein [unclassified Azospirillum]
MGHLLEALGSIIVSVIATLGYPGVAMLMALESACIPLPSEVIMPFAGYLVSTGHFNLMLVATVGAIGCNLGSEIAYAVGRRGGRPLIRRWGRYVLLDEHDLDLAERFFSRLGGPAVLVARLLPVVRTFIALPAGMAGMPRFRFHLYTFIGSWPWCFGLAYVGYALGERWNSDLTLRDWMHRFDVLVIVLIVAAVAWFLWRRLRTPAKPNR